MQNFWGIHMYNMLKILSKFFKENFQIWKKCFHKLSDKIIKSISGLLTALLKFKFVKMNVNFLFRSLVKIKSLEIPFFLSCYEHNSIPILYLTTIIESYFLLTWQFNISNIDEFVWKHLILAIFLHCRYF